MSWLHRLHAQAGQRRGDVLHHAVYRALCGASEPRRIADNRLPVALVLAVRIWNRLISVSFWACIAVQTTFRRTRRSPAS